MPSTVSIPIEVRGLPEIVDLLDRLTRIEGHEGQPWDEVQGYCMWCGGGWQEVSGPRGGKPRPRHTGAHKGDCAYVLAREIVARHG